MPSRLLPVVLLLGLAATPVARADDGVGGAAPPASSSSTPSGTTAEGTGGAAPGTATPVPKHHTKHSGGAAVGTRLSVKQQRAQERRREARLRAKRRARRRARREAVPDLASLSASRTVYTPGPRLTVRLALTGGHATHLGLALVTRGGGRVIAHTDLGTVTPGESVRRQWTLGNVSPGYYTVKVMGVVHHGALAAGRPVTVHSAHFPLLGPHDFGGPGARFGAGRTGHIHQGQDVIAAEGTPIVAPVAGTISWRSNQPGGAGLYLVLHAVDGHDYVFMHLRPGTILVDQGSRVRTGQRLAEVGHTGDATGPHLHFEVWVGGWQQGHPIDPLPLLERWDAWS